MTIISNLKKRKEMIKILQYQYMTLKIEVGELKERKLKSDSVKKEKEYEYLGLLANFSELKKKFGLKLDNQIYGESFILINEKYNAYIESEKVSIALQELLNKRLDALVVHKRKVDHLINTIKKDELNILFENI
jgi:ABC-type amino acid transport substrate-binding protein